MGGDSQVGFLDVLGGLGYSFAVAMQPFRDDGGSTDPSIPLNQNVAAIFMHELGHNLGLCHGGPNIDDPIGGCSRYFGTGIRSTQVTATPLIEQATSSPGEKRPRP